MLPTLQELVQDNNEKIKFQWIAGQSSSNRLISDEDTSAANIVGHLNLIHPSRIQIFGLEEMDYYIRLEKSRQINYIKELYNGKSPAILIANNLQAPQILINNCSQYNIPLLSTHIDAAKLIDILRVYISKKLAPIETIHGVFLDVFGIGVLITGKSGLGKSELALELISRGHVLIADDVVELFQVAPSIVEGKCPALLQNLLEVRGLGLLDIRTIFGEIAVRHKMRLKLVVNLTKQSSNDTSFERLPLQKVVTQNILGIPIRSVTIQVAAGRNLAVIVEAAVRNTILQMRGIDTLGDFIERQTIAILSNNT
ncbi:HPr(Ser) kinase/phosphatase [Candidatus Kinetoplastidibacterium galati]|uniref:HPr kinase/phosphorylase n=1 Tax=Candidatus Kinetoplastidibacterium galati TCC219 TaxID=1208921 RepID=M1M2B2_9PROT|nr:HPr(Ser) kinase/phosphatase [Candidatus Kinetoplastibacterium galatii]AGF49354.1 HPr kinase/phosphorylase [Candidatus Kinetoplastibacterium galatii TCC219]